MSLLSNYGVRAQVGEEIVTSGLQLYLDAGNPNSYPGSGTTWLDISGNGRHATLVNGPSYNTEANGVLIFNGSNQQANLGTWFTFQNFTISTWIKPGTSQKQYADIFDNNHTGFRNWVCQQDNTTLNTYIFAVLPTNGVASSTGNFNLNSNTWYNLVFTFDGSRVRGYINTTLIGTGNPVTTSSISGTARNSRTLTIDGISYTSTYGRSIAGGETCIAVASTNCANAPHCCIATSPANCTYTACRTDQVKCTT
jgi:hypothetical protein